jgi:hypothetical protein
MKSSEAQIDNWIRFLEKKISVIVLKGASEGKIAALMGNFKRLKGIRNDETKIDRNNDKKI